MPYEQHSNAKVNRSTENSPTVLDLYNGFEQSILRRVFQNSYSGNLKTYDLISHIDHMAAEHNLESTSVYWSLRNDLHNFACQHRALIHGSIGERRAYNAIKHASSVRTLFTNIILNFDGESVEIDCLAITNAGMFCIETKNYSHNLTVTEDGSFRKVDGRSYNDYNIGERMAANKYVVLSAIKEKMSGMADIPVYGILLNASRSATITNLFPHVDLCSLGNIAALIDSISLDHSILAPSQIDEITSLLEKASRRETATEPESFGQIANGLESFIKAIEFATQDKHQEKFEESTSYPASSQADQKPQKLPIREITICIGSLLAGALGGYALSKTI